MSDKYKDIMNELDVWLKKSLSAYESGEHMSMAEAIHGESNTKEIISKIEELKIKHGIDVNV